MEAKTVDGVHKPASGSRSWGLLNVFPLAFLFILCLLFLGPTWATFRLESTAPVYYFSSHAGWGVVVVPLVILVSYIVNARHGGPHKHAIIVGLLLPSLILMVCSLVQFFFAWKMASGLLDADCAALPAKQRLQDSWLAAQNVHDACFNATASNYKVTVQQLNQYFSITDCEEYAGLLSGAPDASSAGNGSAAAGNSTAGSGSPVYKRDWDYLQGLEEQFGCAGWCSQGEPIWTAATVTGGTRDTCSRAVAQALKDKVRPRSFQVFIASLLIMATCGVLFVVLMPLLRKNGLEW